MKRLMLALFLIVAFLLSCRKGEEEKFTGERGGKLIIGTIDEPTSLNPIYPPLGKSIGVEKLLFLSLHGRNSQGKIVPELATSWEYSEDFKSIIYYLRKNVKWSDGESFTANDVKFTFDLIKNPDVGSPLTASVRFIDSVKVINQYEICFYFRRAYADELLDSGITPLPEHILKDIRDLKYAAFNSSPVGNGPYKLEEWKKGESLTLVADEGYYKGKAALEEVVFWFAPDEEELSMELLEGNIDIVTDVTPSLYARIKDKSDINLVVKPGHTYTYIGWNLEKPLFAKDTMRLALTYAIDRKRLVKDVLLDLADIAKGPIPPTSWAYDDELSPIPYNMERAANFLDKLGWKLNKLDKMRKKGKEKLTFSLITNKENSIRVAIANFIAAELKKVGIDVKTEFLDTPTFINRLVSKDFDAFILGWSIEERIDPTIVWNSDPSKGKFNLVSYKNPKIDSMIDRGLLALDRRETKEIWKEFQDIIARDLPNTFLFYPKEISAASKRVSGINGNDSRFILADLEHYWIPSSLRKTIDVASFVDTIKKEGEIAKEKIEPEKPIVNPEVLLEKKAKEEVAKEAISKSTKEVTEKKETGKETTPEVKPPKPETTEVVKESPPEIPPTFPKIKKLVMPEYPEAAKLVGAEGNVFVQVVISINGKVKKAKIVKTFGNPVCDATALAAARATIWIPGTKNGEPTEMSQTYPIRFPPQ